MTPEQNQKALFGKYFGGVDAPLIGLPPVKPVVESQLAFVTRQRIFKEIEDKKV